MTDIYDLYLSYKRRDIDNYFLERAYEIFIKEDESLIPFISDFQITDTSTNSLGNYSIDKKILKINKNAINDLGESPSNVVALQVLKHELGHAKSIQSLLSGKKDIKTLLTLFSIRSFAISQNWDYIPNMSEMDLKLLSFNIVNNYETNPEERRVNIEAWKYLVNLLKNQNKTKDLLYARTMLFYSYIRGYKDNQYYLDCPAYSFLINTGQLNDFKRLKNKVDSKDYSFDTRLHCGLPISYDEYDNQILSKVKLQIKKRE